MSYDLSVLIPARNEYYYEIDLLYETVTNVLANTSNHTEVIAVLDGYDNGWPIQPLPSNPRLTIIQHRKSIGQRAATNEAARVATGEYVVKLDSHCALSKNFDEKLLATFEPHWTVTPALYNLLVFVWKCKQCGWLKDQSPKPEKCKKCGSQFLKQVKKWHPRNGAPGSDVDRPGGCRNSFLRSWRFDTKLEYQQWGSWSNTQQGPVIDTMSLLGACWAMRRERYFEIQPCDEKYGSWGQQGTEIACKTWLSGGELKTNTNAWFAHFFRVGGIGFPYSGGGQKERAMARCREMWLQNQWPLQKYPLSWLIDKFNPPDWNTDGNPVTAQVRAAGEEFYRRQGKAVVATPVTSKQKTKAALYYTCNSHDKTLELAARNNLKAATNGHELGCVALQRTDFGDWTIVIDKEKSGGTMHYQILAGLERSTADYVFLCESDVFYHKSHFDFTPPRDDTFYYNTNVWRVRYSDGHAVRTDNLQQVSGICANRKLLLDHYRRRVETIEQNGGSFNAKRMAYEPGTRGKFGDERIGNWESEYPNIDITGHGQTLTTPHFSVDSFRNPKYSRGWRETDEQIEGWPKLAGRIPEFLAELANG